MTIAKKRKEYRIINILFKTIYKKKSAKWRGDYLREKHIFHHIGENVHLWGGVPSDPYLISMFFASTFSSKMQIDFLKVAWGISPLLHFLLRHSFGCRRGVVAGIQSLLVTDM